MNDVLDQVILNLDPIVASNNCYLNAVVPEKLITLMNNGQEIVAIHKDGTVSINPAYTASQAADEFWKRISSQANVVQVAVEAAKRNEREVCAKQVENQGKVWGVMRSLKMTYHAEAAQKLADLLRK